MSMVDRRKSELEEANAKLNAMLIEQDELATRIAKQKRRIAALIELSELGEDSRPPIGLVTGLTDACRIVFRSAEKPLLPTDVRDRVERLGVPEQKDLLASVHTVIRRLRDAREIKEVPPKISSGPMKYEWNGAVLQLSDLVK
jgi:hypothetical protein